MTIRKLFCFIGFFLLSQVNIAQTSDDNYQRPLTEVIKEIENRYNVELRFSGVNIEGLVLNYADWRFRPELEKTLANVLAPFDLSFSSDGGPNKFKIQKYQHYQRSVQDAKATLDHLASLYSDKSEWEIRRQELKACIKSAIRLDKLPASPGSKPILSEIRKMDGYTVQNMALEVLPGFYVAGSIYRPEIIDGKIPIILCPNGHFENGRYHEQTQKRCAGLARMGAITVNYDLFGWGESGLQVGYESHRTSMANTIQVLNSYRILDYLLTLDAADPDRIAITGGSGGGSHSMLMAAIDDRIDVSVPVVMMSAIHYGGCPCESGNPLHFCGGGTNNVEIAGLFAPKPQLVISDGLDWTANVPDLEFPFLKRIYGFYKNAIVQNEHFPGEGHDYGPSKRTAMYHFLVDHLALNENGIFDADGNLDETAIVIEDADAMKIFGQEGEKLPENAIRSFEELVQIFDSETNRKP